MRCLPGGSGFVFRRRVGKAAKPCVPTRGSPRAGRETVFKSDLPDGGIRWHEPRPSAHPAVLERRHGVTNSHYRWVIVAAGGLLGCVAIGAMFSLPVFLLPISRDTGWSVTGVSSAMTIGFIAMALASMVWGSLSDRFGPRVVVLIGSVVLAGALALASRATSLVEFQLTFGLVVGSAIAAIFAPMMACVTGWFDTHRSLAVSLVSAGNGNGADDHVAAGGVARLHLRLANITPDHRVRRRGVDDSGGVSGAPSPGSRCRECRRFVG